MPHTFSLPTTSDISYTQFFQSSTHPCLIVTATTHRAAVRSVLKKHKRLPAQSQSSNISNVLSALEDYIPYLFAIDAGLGGKRVDEEEIEIALLAEVEVEWRTSALAVAIPGREASRPKGRGLDYEICFVLSTLAYVSTLLAQSQLHALYASITPTPEQRTGIITKATKYLLQANSIHNYLIKRADETASPSAIETSSSGQEALAELALAEATLLAVLKDDPYPAIVAQDRNMNDNEWKYKAPEIPKVRAHLFARLCLAAAGHAEKADLMLNASTSRNKIRVHDRLTKYINDLRRTSKAKAYRLFGIDAELGGETGQAIAWLLASKKELGFSVTQEGSSKMKGLAKLKNQWTERREDRKIEKGGEWGSDAGRFEEARIVEMLEKKWNKMNDTINTQIIPSSDTLLAKTPTGRDIHSPTLFVPPSLEVDTLARMRAPADADELDAASSEEDDSSDLNNDEEEEEEEGGGDGRSDRTPGSSHEHGPLIVGSSSSTGEIIY